MSVQLHTLSNGLRIATDHMPGLQSASIGVWVQAGGRHERIEQNGIAHFLEHMAFKGTKSRSALAIAEAIEDVGGYINAYTSREMTAYYARVLQSDVPLALDVIADILMHSVLDSHEIEVERGVILQEIGQALDTPDDIIFDWLQETAYPDQALGRTILGPTERVQSFSRANLAGFISEHYSPDQMILCAAGAVDHDALCQQAEALFGGLNTPTRTSTLDPARFQGGERREVKSLEQVHIALAFEGPTYRDDEIFAAQVYANAMGGGMSSRLFQEVREKRGLCYTIFAQAGAYEDTGLITLYAGTSADEIAELTNVTVDEMKRATTDMSEAEITRAKVQMKAGMLMGLESPSNRAERLARMLSIWGRVPTIDEAVEKIDAVTLTGVRTFAERMAGNTGTALTLYGPADAAPTIAQIRERFAA